MTRNPLILDCDGVLLDWLGGFCPFAETALNRTLDPSGPRCFTLDDWLGTDSATTYSLVTQFHSDEDGYFSALPPMPGAIPALESATRSGRALIVVTSCAEDPRVVALRRENLHQVFGPIFQDVICLPLHGSKVPILEDLPSGSWVEDKLENAVDGARCGHRSYLMRTSHNRDRDDIHLHDNLTWFSGWECIRHLEGL